MHFRLFTLYRLTTRLYGIERVRFSFVAEKLSHEEVLVKVEPFKIAVRRLNLIDDDLMRLGDGGAVYPHFAWIQARKRKQVNRYR